MKYFPQLRSHEAARLLISTDMTPDETGKAIRIDDQYNFKRFFEKNIGKTPAEF